MPLAPVSTSLRRVLKKDGKIFITNVDQAIRIRTYDFRRFTSFGIKKFFEKQNFNIVEFKKILQGKNSVIQIIDSEFTRYIRHINSSSNKNFKLILFFYLKITLKIIKLLFLFLPSNIFNNFTIFIFKLGKKDLKAERYTK